MAVPAAPAPLITTLRELISRPVTRHELTRRGEEDDGGAVLVVVKDGDAEVLQAVFDFETAGGRDIFEVDAAEDGSEGAHDADDLLGLLGVEAEWPRVDVRVFFKEESFALHDGNGSASSNVAEPKDGGAITDDRDGVALEGKLAG